MLCLRASFNLYIVVRGAAARYGCVIDTLFHTLSRVDGARPPLAPRTTGQRSQLGTQNPLQGEVVRCLADTLRSRSPVEQVKVGAQKRERLLGLPVSA
jgi:hypothetical protein